MAWRVLIETFMAAPAVDISTHSEKTRSRRTRRKAARRNEPAVRVVEAGNGSRSVVEFMAPKVDNPLYRAFRALRELGIQIVHAEVRAMSEGMLQRFYLLESDGRSLEPGRLSQVLAALSRARPLALSDRLGSASLCA